MVPIDHRKKDAAEKVHRIDVLNGEGPRLTEYQWLDDLKGGLLCRIHPARIAALADNPELACAKMAVHPPQLLRPDDGGAPDIRNDDRLTPRMVSLARKDPLQPIREHVLL